MRVRLGRLLLLACLPPAAAHAAASPLDGFVVEPPRAPAGARSLARDRAGFLWIGGTGDLVRHDGDGARTFTDRLFPPWLRPTFLQVAATPDGALWVALGEGRARLADGRVVLDEVWNAPELIRWRDGAIRYMTAADGWPRPRVWALLVAPDGSLWAGTARGAAHLVPGQRIQFYGPERGLPGTGLVLALAFDRGQLVPATPEGLYRLQGERFVSAGLAEPLLALAAGAGQRLWAGGRDVVELRGGVVARRFAREGGLPAGDVHALAPSADGGVWVAAGTGLARIAPSGEVQTMAPAAGLPAAPIDALHEDEGGSLWIAARDGVTRLRRRLATPPPDLPAPGPAFAVLRARDGAMIVTTASAVWRHHGGAWSSWRAGVELPAVEPRSLAEDADGGLWVATSGQGLLWLRPGASGPARARLFTARDGLASDQVRMVLVSRAGALWLGFADGRVASYRRPSTADDRLALLASATPADGLCRGPVVSGLEASDGTIWFASPGAGLSSWRDGRAACRSSVHGLPSDGVEALAESPAGVLWVGSRPDAGISRLAGGRIATVNSDRGLFCDSVHELVPDGAYVWVACAGGIARVARAQLEAAADGALPFAASTGWNAREGLSGGGTEAGWHPVAALAPDGALWVATPAGVSVVPAPAAPRAGGPVVHAPVIDQVLLDGRVLDPARTIVATGDRFDLTIAYTAPSFVAHDHLQLRHRLVRVDGARAPDAWALAPPTRVAHFSGLAPGRYRFEALASDGLGGWQTTAAAVALSLRPVFWRRPELLVTAGAAVLVALLLLHRWRLHRQAALFRAVQEERARLARELHDSLGQTFASVGFHLDALRRVLGATAPDVKDILSRTRAIVDHSQRQVRASIWSLRSPAAQALPLERALGAVIEAQRKSAGRDDPPVTLSVDGAPFPRVPLLEHELPEIAREAVRNAVRHARATHVSVSLARTDDAVVLEVRDDGCGIGDGHTAPASDGHFGLVGMHERAARVGGTLHVHGAPGGGTLVRLEAPLAPEEAVPA